MNWKKKKLNEFCEFNNGLWTGKKPPFQKVGVIRNTNFTKDCILDDSDIVSLEVEQSQFQKRKLQYGDIILEKSGGGPKQPVGRVVIFDKNDGDFSFSNFTSVIRIKNKNEVDFNFLHRYLFLEYISGATEKMQSHSTGIRNLKFDEYKEIEIPLPSLPEQQRIVSLLDETFTAIDKALANAQQNLKNAKELFESYLQFNFSSKVHGDKFDSLDSLCELIVDCEHKTAPNQDKGYPSIRTPNIGKGDLILDNVNRVSYETYLNWTRRAVPQAGDLILAREAPAGNIAVIPENLEVCLGQRTVLLRPKIDKLIPRYLAYLILSKDVQEILLSHSTGATVQHINMKDIRAFKIYDLSDLKEQITVVNKLDALREETHKLERIYQQKIADLEEMKKSILQKAFAGELNTEKSRRDDTIIKKDDHTQKQNPERVI
jgi:type I restriction enzyme S subunit